MKENRVNKVLLEKMKNEGLKQILVSFSTSSNIFFNREMVSSRGENGYSFVKGKWRT